MTRRMDDDDIRATEHLLRIVKRRIEEQAKVQADLRVAQEQAQEALRAAHEKVEASQQAAKEAVQKAATAAQIAEMRKDAERWRQDMLRSINQLWWLFAAVVVITGPLLIWRQGWVIGVPTTLWLAFWCGWAKVVPWGVAKIRKMMS